jgi:acyl carrier protein
MIEGCRSLGARVEIRAVDAGDVGAMKTLFADVVSTLPPLRGIIHAAGVIDDGLLVGQTQERWQAVVHGKAGGARALDSLTRHADLDFFILYSAAGWILGPIGQGAYAAANAELDALAWARRAAGLPALSVAWGQWKDAGMAARTAGQGSTRWSARGLGWLDADRAFGQLERLLTADAVQAMVQPIDWRQFMSALPGSLDAEAFRAVAPAPAVNRTGPSAAARPGAVSVVESWRTAPVNERRSLVLAHVSAQACHVIGVEAGVTLDAGVALKDQGLDSLMAVELRNALTRSLKVMLPATLLFDYPTLDALVRHLLTSLDLTGVAVPTAPADGTGGADDVAAMSDAEAEALLLAELDNGATGGRP